MKFSISDLELEEALGTSHRFFYDVRTRKGRCRTAECYSGSGEQNKLVSFDLAIFEFQNDNHQLFMMDESIRFELLGEKTKHVENLGDEYLLAISMESKHAGAFYYSILVDNFVFRMVFGLANLETSDNATEMLHPVIQGFLEKHQDIGLRT